MARVVADVLLAALKWFLIIMTSLVVFGLTWATKSVLLVGKPDSIGTVEGAIIMSFYALGPVAGISLFAATIRRGLFSNNAHFTRLMIAGTLLGLIVAAVVPPDEYPSQL